MIDSIRHKELFLYIAQIQEKLGNLKGAYDSYTQLETHHRTFPIASSEYCRLFCIDLVKRKLQFFLNESSNNVTKEEMPPSELESKERSRRKSRSKKQPEIILLVEKVAELTSSVERITLPSTDLSITKILENDIKLKGQEASSLTLTIQPEDNDNHWKVVSKIRSVPKMDIPYDITTETVERDACYKILPLSSSVC